MPAEENQLDVPVALESVSYDHGFDSPDMTLESVVPAHRRPLRPLQVVDRTDRRSMRPQTDELPLRIAERPQSGQ
jgi:hypothetical protein